MTSLLVEGISEVKFYTIHPLWNIFSFFVLFKEFTPNNLLLF